jgi:hypothetical protein
VVLYAEAFPAELEMLEVTERGEDGDEFVDLGQRVIRQNYKIRSYDRVLAGDLHHVHYRPNPRTYLSTADSNLEFSLGLQQIMPDITDDHKYGCHPRSQRYLESGVFEDGFRVLV